MRNFFIFIVLFCASGNLTAIDITHVSLEQICKPPYSSGAILRRDSLFVDDFLTLHSLLRMAGPASVFEIGTCSGEGTLIIKNAVGEGVVYSLELPLGESSYDIQRIGHFCYLPYNQIIGDSLLVDYSAYYPIEAWFIDGAHDYMHVLYETKQALLSNPKLIVWHDADIPEIIEAIKDGLENSGFLLFRVDQTRVAFAVSSESEMLGVIND